MIILFNSIFISITILPSICIRIRKSFYDFVSNYTQHSINTQVIIWSSPCSRLFCYVSNKWINVIMVIIVYFTLDKNWACCVYLRTLVCSLLIVRFFNIKPSSIAHNINESFNNNLLSLCPCTIIVLKENFKIDSFFCLKCIRLDKF